MQDATSIPQFWQERPLLFFDAQTTGMRPSVGRLLEVAWSIASARTSSAPPIRSFVLQLPEGETLHPRIREITGIGEQDFESALESPEALRMLLSDLEKLPERPLVAIHYAQFESAFLTDWFERELGLLQLPFDVLCTHRVAKRVHPALPSRNLRAVAGFFGDRIKELKRAGPHVAATISIWRSLAPVLDEAGLRTLADVEAWLKPPPSNRSKKKTAPKIEYRVDRLARLALPDSPGIYRMKARDGEVLYVGKATSLKSRVNSYFRGKKGREPRKLELMAQVWDLEVTECGSALEAALLECDEIKRYDPPYNVVMKERARSLLFYDHDFVSTSRQADSLHCEGPYRPMGSVEDLRLLASWLATDEPMPIFYEPFEETQLREGFLTLTNRYDLDPHALSAPRTLLALGAWLLSKKLREEALAAKLIDTEAGDDSLVANEVVDEDEASRSSIERETAEPTELSNDELADKFERLLMRAARARQRAKLMTRLLNSTVTWFEDEKPRTLEVVNGKIHSADDTGRMDAKPIGLWSGLGIADFDRMSVLLSELAKHPHEISPRFREVDSTSTARIESLTSL